MRIAHLLTAAILLAGCNATRPTESIRTSAQHAYGIGDHARAAEEYSLIVERYPGDWDAQHKLGRSLMKLERYTEARRALEIAYTRRPQNDDIAEALAETMFQQGDEQHLFAFLRERAESTQSVDAYLRLARYAMEMNDPDSARVAIETAIEVDDGRRIEPYLAAADHARHIGDVELAVRRLRQAYGINPHDPRANDGLRSLGEVPGPTLALPPGRAVVAP